jgi:hypothetical protein
VVINITTLLLVNILVGCRLQYYAKFILLFKETPGVVASHDE